MLATLVRVGGLVVIVIVVVTDVKVSTSLADVIVYQMNHRSSCH